GTVRPLPGPAAVLADLRAGLPDAGLRPRARDHPPGPEAGQRHGGRLRRSAGHGLGARQNPGEPGGTQAGSVLGTPAYMAPEQARGEVDRLNERCDVFGLGAILCEILTGSPPYGGATLYVLAQAGAGLLEDALDRLAR